MIFAPLPLKMLLLTQTRYDEKLRLIGQFIDPCHSDDRCRRTTGTTRRIPLTHTYTFWAGLHLRKVDPPHYSLSQLSRALPEAISNKSSNPTSNCSPILISLAYFLDFLFRNERHSLNNLVIFATHSHFSQVGIPTKLFPRRRIPLIIFPKHYRVSVALARPTLARSTYILRGWCSWHEPKLKFRSYCLKKIQRRGDTFENRE